MDEDEQRLVRIEVTQNAILEQLASMRVDQREHSQHQDTSFRRIAERLDSGGKSIAVLEQRVHTMEPKVEASERAINRGYGVIGAITVGAGAIGAMVTNFLSRGTP